MQLGLEFLVADTRRTECIQPVQAHTASAPTRGHKRDHQRAAAMPGQPDTLRLADQFQTPTVQMLPDACDGLADATMHPSHRVIDQPDLQIVPPVSHLVGAACSDNRVLPVGCHKSDVIFLLDPYYPAVVARHAMAQQFSDRLVLWCIREI